MSNEIDLKGASWFVALTLEHKSALLASYMHGVFNSQAYGVWTILYPDYNRLIGGIGGLIGVIVLLPVALYYLRKDESQGIV